MSTAARNDVRMSRLPGGLRAMWNAPIGSDGVAVAWLGQAGFAIRTGDLSIMIDPYLSDSLEAKYRDSGPSHARLMPAPVRPELVRDLNYVLCSHSHSDHMDPETLAALAVGNPRCRFVVPGAELDTARARGVPADRTIAAKPCQHLRLSSGIDLETIAAAHEAPPVSARDDHPFLGFIIRFEGLTLYHSGDSVVYGGLSETLATASIDVAMLPVNGRGRGVPGNMTFEEALELCRAAGVRWLIPQHFGMFAFNTIDTAQLITRVQETRAPRCVVPDTGHFLLFQPSPHS
jgi:L-ascorbate metabolism protein UlaG (beta-lactamase superfamily)